MTWILWIVGWLVVSFLLYQAMGTRLDRWAKEGLPRWALPILWTAFFPLIVVFFIGIMGAELQKRYREWRQR